MSAATSAAKVGPDSTAISRSGITCAITSPIRRAGVALDALGADHHGRARASTGSTCRATERRCCDGRDQDREGPLPRAPPPCRCDEDVLRQLDRCRGTDWRRVARTASTKRCSSRAHRRTVRAGAPGDERPRRAQEAAADDGDGVEELQASPRRVGVRLRRWWSMVTLPKMSAREFSRPPRRRGNAYRARLAHDDGLVRASQRKRQIHPSVAVERCQTRRGRVECAEMFRSSIEHPCFSKKLRW